MDPVQVQDQDFGNVKYSLNYARSQAKKYKNFSLPSPKYYTGYFAFRFLRYMSLPFDKWKAYRLGIIDADGHELRKAQGQDEKRVWNYYIKLIAQIKTLLNKQLDWSRFSLVIDRLFLVRESINNNEIHNTMEYFLTEVDKLESGEIHRLLENTMSGGMATSGQGMSDMDSSDNGDYEKNKTDNKEQEAKKRVDTKLKKKKKKKKTVKETLSFKDYIAEGRPRLIKFIIKENEHKWSVKNTETGKIYYLKRLMDSIQNNPVDNIYSFLSSVNAYDGGYYKKTFQLVDRREMAQKIVSEGSTEIWIPENRENIIQTTWEFHDTKTVPSI
jgi:hypothetical protein